jgi:hypothetical protein
VHIDKNVGLVNDFFANELFDDIFECNNTDCAVRIAWEVGD